MRRPSDRYRLPAFRRPRRIAERLIQPFPDPGRLTDFGKADIGPFVWLRPVMGAEQSVPEAGEGREIAVEMPLFQRMMDAVPLRTRDHRRQDAEMEPDVGVDEIAPQPEHDERRDPVWGDARSKLPGGNLYFACGGQWEAGKDVVNIMGAYGSFPPCGATKKSSCLLMLALV